MSTAFADYPLADIAPHPRNVRRVALADDEMIASVATTGILEPVVLGPEVGGLRYLIAGNRRYDAAVKAGLDTIPAVIRDDLDTDAAQVSAMVQENLHRVDLTAVEEAEAYEQLQLFGMDIDAITAATGRSASTVKKRLRLTDLSTKAKDSIEAGVLTLTDAEGLLEFADDADTLATLEAAMGTGDFAWRLQSARSGRKSREHKAALVADFEAQGIARTETADWSDALSRFTATELREPAGHDSCLAFLPTSHGDPFLVCTAREGHAEVENAARVDAGYSRVATPEEREEYERAAEAAREETRAKQAEIAAQKIVKVQWITEHLTGLLTGARKGAALDAALRSLIAPLLDQHDVVDTSLLLSSLGVEFDSLHGASAKASEYAESLLDAKKGAGVEALAALIAVLVTHATLTDEVYLDTVSEHRRVLGVWDYLTDQGYQLSTADSDIRAAAQQGLDDLLDEDGDS